MKGVKSVKGVKGEKGVKGGKGEKSVKGGKGVKGVKGVKGENRVAGVRRISPQDVTNCPPPPQGWGLNIKRENPQINLWAPSTALRTCSHFYCFFVVWSL